MKYISGDAHPSHVPSVLQRVAISERDAILTENFRTRLLQNRTHLDHVDNIAVAVVGRAHLTGIRNLWDANVAADDFVKLTAGEQVAESWWFPLWAMPFERYMSRGFS